MARRLLTPEQIINRLRETEVLLSQGATVAQASSPLVGLTGITICDKR